MNEMIERVARALCVASGKDPDADSRKLPNGLILDIALEDPRTWRLYIKKARVAIGAMREPTDAMCIAAEADLYDGDELIARYAWPIMIDAVLK